MTDVLMLIGLHVPGLPSFDVGGSAGTVVFRQYEADMVGNVGEILPTIVMFIDVGVAQLPADDGVNL